VDIGTESRCRLVQDPHRSRAVISSYSIFKTVGYHIRSILQPTVWIVGQAAQLFQTIHHSLSMRSWLAIQHYIMIVRHHRCEYHVSSSGDDPILLEVTIVRIHPSFITQEPLRYSAVAVQKVIRVVFFPLAYEPLHTRPTELNYLRAGEQILYCNGQLHL